ncbi:hypothetical protein QJS10_CPB12g00301 [Acorus calamus]|uniref:Origin of replication complex subunit 4 n=1 Tax=Acorus calamus TaxID=4465 RepID=A0AAV9DJU9_ACOCL|nr:hypothetical protein QJS10_CPB12g00301 [Acorus calamus]
MEAETPSAEKTLNLLRSRLRNPNFIFSPLRSSPDSNYSKLKFLISNSLTEGCNTSVLLLGPRGCGKSAVLELVLGDLQTEYADMISVVRLNGLLHSDDTCSLKSLCDLRLLPFLYERGFEEVARQLCMEHHLLFSKMASSDDNSEFMIDMLRECGLAHKTIIFVLDEFDLFTQGKQRLLYSLLDAMQSLSSQAVVIGLSCRLDADQLLEKRVRSRFSHRKLLFDPPPIEELHSIGSFGKWVSSLEGCGLEFVECPWRRSEFEGMQFLAYEGNPSRKIYKAFEHLLDRGLIGFTDSKGRSQSIEFRPVRLLIAPQELYQGLKSNRSCPVAKVIVETIVADIIQIACTDKFLCDGIKGAHGDKKVGPDQYGSGDEACEELQPD